MLSTSNRQTHARVLRKKKLPSVDDALMAQKSRWHERLFGKQLIKCDALSTTDDFLQHVQTSELLGGADIVGVYFSFANISSQSDEFIKRLKELYCRLNEKVFAEGNKRLEVVQVVMWANNDVYSDFENSHRDSLLGMPWYAMPYSEIDLKVTYGSVNNLEILFGGFCSTEDGSLDVEIV